MRDPRTVTARVARALLAACVLLACGAPTARAGATAQRLGGHIALGYTKLFISDAPGGSLSVAGGMDYPIRDDLRIGADVAYSLLGSTTVEEDIQLANLEYSLLEVGALAHWHPRGLGPVARISAGPTVARANAAISTSGGSLAFSKYAIEEIVPGAAFDVTLMKQETKSPVVAGLQLGVHFAFVPDETWVLFNARLAIHY
jgi:hypothetical protein